MPVDTTHPSYDRATDRWRRVRDLVEGADAVRDGGTRYLPRPSGMSPSEYAAYLRRAVFYNATARTQAGLVGALFRRSPTLVGWPTAMESRLASIDGAGTDLESLAKDVAAEVVAVGRVGLLTELSPAGEPLLRWYRAEDIINWHEEPVDGVPALAWVVLRETLRRPRSTDTFYVEEVERYRVLRLDERGRYEQQVWERAQNPTSLLPGALVLVETVRPVNRGRPLAFIPFTLVGPGSLRPAVGRGPLDDLAELNVAHWRVSADVEHAAHHVALPTAWITGFRPDAGTDTMQLGSGTVWIFEDPQARVGLLTLDPNGLGALEGRLASHERLMAVVGARLLDDQKLAAEAAATVAMRHAGENSVLASISRTLSLALTRNLRWLLDWVGSPAEVAYTLTTDFLATPLTSQELTALVAAWQAGAVGTDFLVHQLRQGERLPEGWTAEDFAADRDAGRAGGAAGIST